MMDSPFDGPAEAVQEHWSELQSDISALRSDYESEGWSIVELHPGDITPMRGEGSKSALLDILLPDNELKEVDAIVNQAGLDSVDVYREVADGTIFLVVVLLSADAETAVIYPIYYDVPRASALIEHTQSEGCLTVRFRNLADTEAVLVEHPEYRPFLPPG